MIPESEPVISRLPLKESGTFVEQLAEKIGASASAKAVFGDPVERDGVMIIPVAKVRYGFGGGGGRKDADQGGGGGGVVQTTPLGYIELKDGKSEFRPIRDPAALVPILLVGGFALRMVLGQLLRPRKP